MRVQVGEPGSAVGAAEKGEQPLEAEPLVPERPVEKPVGAEKPVGKPREVEPVEKALEEKPPVLEERAEAEERADEKPSEPVRASGVPVRRGWGSVCGVARARAASLREGPGGRARRPLG